MSFDSLTVPDDIQNSVCSSMHERVRPMHVIFFFACFLSALSLSRSFAIEPSLPRSVFVCTKYTYPCVIMLLSN